jgi:Holliday junction resolvase RusA-like endonuclease
MDVELFAPVKIGVDPSDTYIFHLKPVKAPRMSRQDKWKGRAVVMEFKAFGIQIRALAEQYKFSMPTNNFHIRFYMPVSNSWSDKKKREMIGKPHQLRPDIDNLFKGFTDALYYIPKGNKKPDNENDCLIYDCRMSKYWCEEGKERIEVEVFNS